MKIAITRKKGVGKTFIAGTLAKLFARDSYNMVVVDANLNFNTASSLEIPVEIAEKIVPITDNDA